MRSVPGKWSQVSRNMGTFIALGSVAERVLEVLEELLDAECQHDHKGKCARGDCGNIEHTVELINSEEVAVRIAELIESGELR